MHCSKNKNDECTNTITLGHFHQYLIIEDCIRNLFLQKVQFNLLEAEHLFQVSKDGTITWSK
jgi:hypothetical protein